MKLYNCRHVLLDICKLYPWKAIPAMNAARAASDFAKLSDEGSATYDRNDGACIDVRDEDGRITRYEISSVKWVLLVGGLAFVCIYCFLQLARVHDEVEQGLYEDEHESR